jgi:exosome complex component RRP4
MSHDTISPSSSSSSVKHLVIPGQILAVSSLSDPNGQDSFLRGHGTYVEKTETEDRLVASVLGIVQRVNKLVTVESVSDGVYVGQVGDLVVGRITSVTSQRWKVRLIPHARDAALPLSGVHLPGGVQRMRTAQDSRDMRSYLQEGDLVSAEVHKTQQDGSLLLHTRSVRYGKLENGCIVTVPPKLIPRRKNHFTTILNQQFQVLWGCNGVIWMQRAMPDLEATGGPELVELQERRRVEHASMPLSPEERRNLARLRNAIECLRLVFCRVTQEAVEQVYETSLALNLNVSQMLVPVNVIRLTEPSRKAEG